MRAVLVLLLAGFCLGWAGTARAHAVLLETAPADRSVISRSPDMVALRFNESVQPIAVELRDSAAMRVPADVVVVDHEIHIVPRAPLADGAYFLSYRVTSSDSHPVAGSVLFAVGHAPAEWAAPTVSAGIYTGWTWAAAINRALFLTSLLIAAGGWVFAFVARRSMPLYRLISPAAGLGVASAVVGIYVQGGVLLDAAGALPWDGDIWRVGLSSTRGTSLVVAAIGLILCMTKIRALACAGMVLAVASFALSGHAATVDPRWIAIPTLVLHIGAAAFWLGSFVPLLNALAQPDAVKTAIFRRFSDLAIVIVPQLLLAGAILAILQIQKPEAFFATAYGLLLALKLTLVSLLLVIAACNRWILTPEMMDNVPGHVGRFRHAIRAELALGILVIGATAFLSQTVPPRTVFEHDAAAVDAARGGGQTVLIAARDYKALLMVAPARPGRNAIRVRVLANDDRLIEPLEVTIDLSNAEAGIEPLKRKLVSAGDGYFKYSGPEFAVAGRWTIRIAALINDFEQSVFETGIDVK
jgi:copper transport protein